MHKIILTIFLLFIPFSTVLAHPGRTASDGCHYCKTNCDKRGVARDVRHCHNGGSTPTFNNTTITKTITTPSCPSNSIYNSIYKSCKCNTGYTKSISDTSCIKIPENAHAISYSMTDVWQCNEGYEENGNKCIKILSNNIITNIQPEIEINKEEEKTTNMNNLQTQFNSNIGNNLQTDTINEEDGSWIWYLIAIGGGYMYYKSKKKNLDNKKNKII